MTDKPLNKPFDRGDNVVIKSKEISKNGGVEDGEELDNNESLDTESSESKELNEESTENKEPDLIDLLKSQKKIASNIEE